MSLLTNHTMGFLGLCLIVWEIDPHAITGVTCAMDQHPIVNPCVEKIELPIKARIAGFGGVIMSGEENNTVSSDVNGHVKVFTVDQLREIYVDMVTREVANRLLPVLDIAKYRDNIHRILDHNVTFEIRAITAEDNYLLKYPHDAEARYDSSRLFLNVFKSSKAEDVQASRGSYALCLKNYYWDTSRSLEEITDGFWDAICELHGFLLRSEKVLLSHWEAQKLLTDTTTTAQTKLHYDVLQGQAKVVDQQIFLPFQKEEAQHGSALVCLGPHESIFGMGFQRFGDELPGGNSGMCYSGGQLSNSMRSYQRLNAGLCTLKSELLKLDLVEEKAEDARSDSLCDKTNFLLCEDQNEKKMAVLAGFEFQGKRLEGLIQDYLNSKVNSGACSESGSLHDGSVYRVFELAPHDDQRPPTSTTTDLRSNVENAKKTAAAAHLDPPRIDKDGYTRDILAMLKAEDLKFIEENFMSESGEFDCSFLWLNVWMNLEPERVKKESVHGANKHLYVMSKPDTIDSVRRGDYWSEENETYEAIFLAGNSGDSGPGAVTFYKFSDIAMFLSSHCFHYGEELDDEKLSCSMEKRFIVVKAKNIKKA